MEICSTGLLVWTLARNRSRSVYAHRAPGGGRHSETRTFKTMTGSLRVMRDWLVESGVTIAAMESTSAYWKPPFYCLEEVMEVWLLNAAHMKAVPGRKSDTGCGVDRAAAGARVVGAVVGAPPEIVGCGC